MDSPLSRSPGSSVLIGVGLPMTRPSSPLGGPHRLEYCWTPPHSSSPPVFVPPAPRPPLLLLLPAPLLLLFQWGECPMGWDAPDPVPPILVWLVPGVACQLVVPPSDWPCAKKRFTSSSPANSARMVVFPSTHLRGDWSTKTNDSWLNALKLTEWNTLNQCADARTCAGTFAPWQLRPWSCSALQHFPVSGWGGMWWGGRVACTVFAESNHQSEKEKTAANGEPAHLILATKGRIFKNCGEASLLPAEWGSSARASYLFWWSCLYSMWYLLCTRKRQQWKEEVCWHVVHTSQAYVKPESSQLSSMGGVNFTHEKTEKLTRVSWFQRSTTTRSSRGVIPACALPVQQPCGRRPHQNASSYESILTTTLTHSTLNTLTSARLTECELFLFAIRFHF